MSGADLCYRRAVVLRYIHGMKLEEVIGLADRALSCDDQEQLVEQIQLYVDAFADWFDHNQDRISSADPAIEALQSKHAAVLARASALRGTFASEMRKVKVRGKGILAYTDIVPKRISSTKPRQG